VKRQDDVLLGHASFHEDLGDVVFGPVVTYPDLAILQVEVQDRSVVAIIVSPSVAHKLVVIAFAVDDGIVLDFLVAASALMILVNQVRDDTPIQV